MPRLEWKAVAVEDLMAIVDHISDDNPTAALSLMADIQTKVAQLAEHPKRCRSDQRIRRFFTIRLATRLSTLASAEVAAIHLPSRTLPPWLVIKLRFCPMYTLVNHLPIKQDADWSQMTRIFDGWCRSAQADHPEVKLIQLVQMGDDAATLIASFESETAMINFSSNVAGPWFAANFREFLSGPADRRTGECLAGFPE